MLRRRPRRQPHCSKRTARSQPLLVPYLGRLKVCWEFGASSCKLSLNALRDPQSPLLSDPFMGPERVSMVSGAKYQHLGETRTAKFMSVSSRQNETPRTSFLHLQVWAMGCMHLFKFTLSTVLHASITDLWWTCSMPIPCPFCAAFH